MTDLRPIQTIYKGYCFRSRLEARWAVFFDQFDGQWAYEVEGFRLPSGHYLPDFLIHPSFTGGFEGAFFEVKPLTSLPTRCFEFGSAGWSNAIDDQFPLEITKMWELINGIDSSRWFHGCVVYGDPYDVVTGGTLVAVTDQVFQDSELLRQFHPEAIIARSARFEHNERWRHESV